MKLLCVACDQPMRLQRSLQEEGATLQVAFACPVCARQLAMLANPAETQLARGLGYRLAGEAQSAEPLATTRRFLGPWAEEQGGPGQAREPRWSPAAERRLERAPEFVQPMIRRLYNDWAREQGIERITPRIMSRAKRQLGMEGL